MPLELDRLRAAGAQQYTFTATTTGNEPLTVDAVLPQNPGEHWILENWSCLANLITRKPDTNGGFPPLSGLFIVPIGTAPESTTEATGGWVMTKRGILVPMGPPGSTVAAINGIAPFPYALTLAPGYKMTLQYGFMLRAIITCAQGTGTPGPGAGSLGVLSGFAYRERDKDPLGCD
jgi:hypothetical protein